MGFVVSVTYLRPTYHKSFKLFSAKVWLYLTFLQIISTKVEGE